ncbi:MAG: nitrous oxide-stimulated promoter family protein [Paludibacter sp.]|nr:nitrous oxide-stimulated promoter family protein [Paludibacter sp.]
MNKIEYQIQTIRKMIALYCKKKHAKPQPCDECADLYEYAKLRLEKCPYGIKKPECRDCTIHCYNEVMRSKMRLVMRFSGPRMLCYYPLDFLKHAVSKKRK